MRALTYYYASENPTVQEAASEAISYAAGVTQEPPPADLPR